MGNADSKSTSAAAASDVCQLPQSDSRTGEPQKKLKPCCACPDTKKIRDECTLMHGEEECGDAIEAHKACMRSHGFNV